MGALPRLTSPILTLALCGAATAAIYVLRFTLPYGISSGIEAPLSHFGSISGGSAQAAAGLIATIAALFVLYAIAIRECHRLEGSRVARAIVYGGGAASALALLWMYPVFSLDVFYYMSADRIWSVFRENPFIVPPLQAAHDAFFPYTRWGHYPLPYGPLWPWLTAATGWFGGGQIAATRVAFKTLAILGYLICLPLVSWAAAGLGHQRRLASLCIFAWNPLVLIELAGGGHNDAVALVRAILAVGLWLRGATRSALLSLTLSLLVKATGIVLLPALAWSGLKRAAEQGQALRWLGTHVAPAVLLAVGAWAPFGLQAAAGQLREAGQYYQTITAVVAGLAPPSIDAFPVRALQAVLVPAFLAAYFSQRRSLATEGAPGLRSIWGITVFYFLVVTPFLSPWYMIWPTAYAAILAERRITILSMLLGFGGLASYVVPFVLRPALGLGPTAASALGLLLLSGPFLVGLAANEAGRRSFGFSGIPTFTRIWQPAPARVVERSRGPVQSEP